MMFCMFSYMHAVSTTGAIMPTGQHVQHSEETACLVDVHLNFLLNNVLEACKIQGFSLPSLKTQGFGIAVDYFKSRSHRVLICFIQNVCSVLPAFSLSSTL